MANNELMHYGVLGMRWGLEKTKTHFLQENLPALQEAYKSAWQKDKKREAAGKRKKYNTQKLHEALRKSQKFDKAVQNRVSSMSKGKTAAQVFLMGSRGALRYNQLRTKGYGRVVSFLGGNLARTYMDSPMGDIARGIATSSRYKAKKK